MNEHRGVIFHLWLSALYRCSEMTCLTVRAVGVKQEPWKKNKVQSESVVFLFLFFQFLPTVKNLPGHINPEAVAGILLSKAGNS